MSGVAVIGELLFAHPPVLAIVSEQSIKPGPLPQSSPLPGFSVALISSVDRNIPHPGAMRRVTDRVQVTAIARSHEELEPLLKLARAACADRIGDFAGYTAVTVHTDSQGPDLVDEQTGIFARSQDFRVGRNEAR